MKVHIGNKITRRMREKRVSIKHLSDKIKLPELRVKKLLGKPSIDTVLLQKISCILNFDFFGFYLKTNVIDARAGRDYHNFIQEFAAVKEEIDTLVRENLLIRELLVLNELDPIQFRRIKKKSKSVI
jgi:hypothetical protein